MDIFTKRFLRDLLLTGLPSGVAWTIFVSFDHEWNVSIIIGAIFGFIVGISIAFINAREFSKNTYPISIKPSPITEIEKREFQPQVFSPIIGVLGIGAIILVFIISLFDSSQSTGLLSTLFLGVLFFFVLLNWLLSYFFTRLSISNNGLEFRSLFYKMTVDWKSVERIERRGKKWFLICRTSEISALSIVSVWLKFIEADKMILLDTFESNFPESNLAKVILHYENQVSIVSTV
jgi:hypothetical protein